MRLDASTAEIVSYLRAQGFQVHHPVDAEIKDTARIALKGGNYAVVYRNKFGKLQTAVETTPPATVEDLTYHDLLTVAVELENRLNAYGTLHADVCGKPGFSAKAREYAEAQNNLTHLLGKVNRIIRGQRTAAYATEARELAAAQFADAT